MENKEQMIYVASSCLCYEYNKSATLTCAGTNKFRSCSNCIHLKLGRCVNDLFDSTLISLD